MSASGRLLVFAIGNDARGDDALGPEMGARIEAAGVPGVDLLVEYQLQVEHALDLRDAGAVLFIDAAVGLSGRFELTRIGADRSAPPLSHALTPAALLAVFERIEGRPPPPAFVLALGGASFALGEPLSASASEVLEQAWRWLQARLSPAALSSAVAYPATQHQQRDRACHDAPEGRSDAEQ